MRPGFEMTAQLKMLLIPGRFINPKLIANPNSPLLMAGIGHTRLIEGKGQDYQSFEAAISLSRAKVLLY